MTLSEFLALDVPALWAGLTPEQQASIVVPLLTSSFAEVCVDDDGTDCSNADKEIAGRVGQDAFQVAMEAIDAAFPTILDADLSALRVFNCAMLDADGKIRVKDYSGRRRPRLRGGYWFVRVNGLWHPIGGCQGEAPNTVAWTCIQVEAERLRRHPEMRRDEQSEQVAA